MSILPQSLRAALRSFSAPLLPGSCLLCATDSPHGLLCPACSTDLPRLPGARCPQCNLPTTHGERCGACLKDPPDFSRTIALFRYEFPVDRIIHALKYGHQLPLAAWLGARLAELANAADHDLVLPLPLHPERLHERGFNQSGEIARSLARALDLPLDVDSLTRTRPTPPQAALPLKERSRNVRGAFACAADLSGKRVLLVDDVMTSGATLRECARVIKLHGASGIAVAVVARALRH